MEIRSENTAISNGAAQSVKSYISNILSPVLDYGAGKLRNAKYLLSEGKEVAVLDTKLQVSRWKEEDLVGFSEIYEDRVSTSKKYKTVLSTFVLNVIPTEVERIHILNEAYNTLEEEGLFICEVRRENGILKNKNLEPYNDGFLVGSGKIRTFQKPFSLEELETLVSSKFKIVESKVLGDSIIVIGRK